MPTFRNSFVAGLLLALSWVSSTPAQQKPSQQAPAQSQDTSVAPIPAYHSPLASQADNGADQNLDASERIVPDDRALAGAEALTLGSSETSRSYWQPHVDLSGSADSNALGQNSGWTTYTSILGGVNVHKISGHSDLTVGYAAGGNFSNDGSIGNSVVQQLNFAEKITVRRVTLSFLENMNYLPQASLGYGLQTGVDGTALQPGLAPLDSVLTTRGQRIDNSFLAEADVHLSPRSSVTMVGGYSLLHYFDNQPNVLNSTTATAQGGYNRQVSAKDTIAVLYRFSDFRYGNGISQTINDNAVQVSYGRRVTGRLALQFGGGPEITFFSSPILNNSAGTSTSASQVNFSASASLTYQLRRAALGGSYFRGVSTGSGVSAGSVTDTVSANLSKQLTRTVAGKINGGYARNRALAIPGFGIYNQSYNYAFAGASLSRPWGRSMNVFVSYQAQYQYSNVGFCAGVTCGTSVVVHLISVGWHWQARPMLF